jgi:zinc protease
LFERRALSVQTLPNGVRSVVRATKGTGVVAVQVWVRAGSRYESEMDSGAAHLIETLALRASKNYPRAIGSPDGGPRDAIEGLGGNVNSLTSRDSTFYAATVAAQFLPQAVRALSDATLNPHLTTASIEEVKLDIGTELQLRESDPLRAVVDLAYRATFTKHPYRKSPYGSSIGIDDLNPVRVRAWHQAQYVGRNISVVVVGDADPRISHALVRRYFGAAGAAKSPARTITPEGQALTFKSIVRQRPINRTAVALSFKVPGINTPNDVVALDVLLSHWREGSDAVLRRVLLGADKTENEDTASPDAETRAPLALAFDVDFLTQRDPGLFTISLVVEPQDRVAAVDATLAEVARVQNEGISEEALVRAKRSLAQQYIQQGETVSGQAGALGFYEMIDTYQFAVDYLDRVAKVTPADVKRVASTYLARSAYVQTVIAPLPREQTPQPDRGGGTLTAQLQTTTLPSN